VTVLFAINFIYMNIH